MLFRAMFFAMALLAAAPSGAAELADAVNAIRSQGCGGQPGAKSPVRSNASLDEVARRLSQGGALSAALERGNYAAMSSTSIHIDGTTEEAAIRRVLRETYCGAVNNPNFSEIGTFRRGDETWLVLAQPLNLPDPSDQQAVARRVLELVNAARRQPRSCGRQKFEATRPLELKSPLSEAARLHARDMARHGAMRHRGSDGSEPADRVTRAGYRWRTVAENVAAGQPSAEAVVAHWLGSPGHCENLMGQQFTQMGAGFAIEQGGTRIYWAQVFAAPR
jgi:uncharacterized protein YkwD